MTTAIPVAKNATVSDVRAPYAIRTKRSRPVSSTPRKYLGGALVSGPGHQVGADGRPNSSSDSRLTWFGAWPDQVAMSGAKIAIRSIRMMITTPASANRSLRKWLQKISQGLRPMIEAGVSADGALMSRSSRAARSRCSAWDTSVSVSDRLMPGTGY